ncbi:efflux transporter, RND family, MFP subunit [compost metagenome]
MPQRALIRGAQGATVLVVGNDGNVAAVPVKAPQAIGDRWIVTEGLKGGEKVIVEGLQKVKVGAPAKAVPFVQADASAPAAAPASASAAPASAPKAEAKQEAKAEGKQG